MSDDVDETMLAMNSVFREFNDTHDEESTSSPEELIGWAVRALAQLNDLEQSGEWTAPQAFTQLTLAAKFIAQVAASIVTMPAGAVMEVWPKELLQVEISAGQVIAITEQELLTTLMQMANRIGVANPLTGEPVHGDDDD